MKLTGGEARSRIVSADHAILCTTHAERGIDAVPVCFAVHEGHVGVPVDLVKPKASTKLQRERNLDADPRAALLVDHWDRNDWSQLWWVRVELRRKRDGRDRATDLAGLLTERYAQYEHSPFARILVFEIVGVSGWAADPLALNDRGEARGTP